jgi:hypothetical protein
MDEPFKTQKNIRFSHQPDLFGLPSAIVGALIGIVLFILLYFVSNAAGSEFRLITWLVSGIMAYYNSEVASRLPWCIIVFGISVIPYAILGALFGPKNKGLTIIGISVFIIYGCPVLDGIQPFRTVSSLAPPARAGVPRIHANFRERFEKFVRIRETLAPGASAGVRGSSFRASR